MSRARGNRVYKANCGFNNSNELSENGPILPVNICSFLEDEKILESDISALVDTGASNSCIDKTLAERLNLRAVDNTTMHGTGGSFSANLYAAKIYVPSLEHTHVGPFAGLDLGNLSCSVLIGRSLLRKFRMRYDGPSGRVELIG